MLKWSRYCAHGMKTSKTEKVDNCDQSGSKSRVKYAIYERSRTLIPASLIYVMSAEQIAFLHKVEKISQIEEKIAM